MTIAQSTDPITMLSAAGAEYRHIREEHEREAPRGTTRRRIKQDMARLVAQFERMLDQWVQDDELREAWRRYIYHGADQPEEPRLSAPPLFRGHNEAGALVVIQAADGGGYDVLLDGALTLHHEVPWHLDPEVIDPVQVGEWSCRETFGAPPEAIAELARLMASPGAEPPWRWAPVLYEDGLIDTNFSLVPRGVRCLRRRREAPVPVDERANFCVLVADAAHARILTLASTTPEGVPTMAQLQEAADLSDPAQRARDSERFTESRPGLRRGAPPGPSGVAGHAVSDRRERHRRESERQFVQLVVEEAAKIWSQFSTCRVVVAAHQRTLGLLRPALARQLGNASPYELVELPRDLSRLAPPAVHDALAIAGMLPARGRMPPLKPMRTQIPGKARQVHAKPS